MAFSAWGIGDWIFALIEGDSRIISKSAKALISLTVGLGTIGQIVFIAGQTGDSYQAEYFWPVFIFAALFSVYRLRKTFSEEPFKLHLQKVDGKEVLILTVIFISFILWLYYALNFTRGSDVISYHYQLVKGCIKLKHFGHIQTLPFKIDVLSSYNPALAQMLFLTGKLLADERAANLINWLSQVMVVMFIYILARDVFSRAAAFMAVAIYFGSSFLFSFPLDVSNYTLLAVFMLASVYCIYLYKHTGLKRYLTCAGITAGFMLSIKYYAVPLVAALCVLLAFWGPSKMKDKIKVIATFCIIAFIVYSPWIVYNLKEFGDPVYPYMSNFELLKLTDLSEREMILAPFIAPTEQGYFWPNVFYYSSLFIPFEREFRVFGLTPIFLIGLPCSIYYFIHFRGKQFQDAHILWVVSMIAYWGIEISSRFKIWYKFGIFAAVIYAVSLSGIFTSWEGKAKQWIWSAIIWVVVLNTFFADKYIYNGLSFPPVLSQEYNWSPLEQYLNESLEKNAGVANHAVNSIYYLRDDIRGLPAYGTWYSLKWQREEEQIRSHNIQYYVFYENERKQATLYYTRVIDFLERAKVYDRAATVRSALAQYLERTRGQEIFLNKFGNIVKELPGGIKIYKLSVQS